MNEWERAAWRAGLVTPRQVMCTLWRAVLVTPRWSVKIFIWLPLVCVSPWDGNWRSERLSMFRRQWTLFPVCDIVHWLVRWQGFVITGKYSDCVPQLSSLVVSPAVFAVAVILLLIFRSENTSSSVFREGIDSYVSSLKLGRVAFFSHPSLSTTLLQVRCTRVGKKIRFCRV